VKKPATSTPRTFGGDLYIVAVVFIAQWIYGDYLYDYSVQSIAKRSMWHCMPPYLSINAAARDAAYHSSFIDDGRRRPSTTYY